MDTFDIAQAAAAPVPVPAERGAKPASRGVRPVRSRGGRRGHAAAQGAVPVRSGRSGVDRVGHRDESRAGHRDGVVEPGAGRACVVPRDRGHRGAAPGGADAIRACSA